MWLPSNVNSNLFSKAQVELGCVVTALGVAGNDVHDDAVILRLLLTPT